MANRLGPSYDGRLDVDERQPGDRAGVDAGAGDADQLRCDDQLLAGVESPTQLVDAVDDESEPTTMTVSGLAAARVLEKSCGAG